MRLISTALILLLAAVPGIAQRPSDPALLVPQAAPELDYVSMPEPLSFPAGTGLAGAPAAVAFDTKGHLFVLTRGNPSLFEFDNNGKFLRSFGQGLFTRSHGLRIDKEGNIWATDVGAHTVMKLDPEGKVLLTLGTKGQRGEWNESTQLFYEPNDVAIASNGDIFVAQGHTPGANGNVGMVAAYSSFARGGTYVEPTKIREVVWADGSDEKLKPAPRRRVVSDRTAFWISDVLSDSEAREYIFGSGGSLDEIIGFIQEKMQNGVIVINAVTIETLNQAIAGLEKFSFTVKVSEISVSRSRLIAGKRHMRAQNPIFIVTGEKG